MKALVTGGYGFIGTELMKHLPDSVVYDQYDGNDVRDFDKIVKQAENFDVVIHLAGVSDVDACDADRDYAWETNVLGTVNAIENAKKFIFVSSASVYGDQFFPAVEWMACEPISLYGETKLAGEQYCQMFSRARELDCIILRLFNVTGSGSKSVVQKFASQDKLTVYGDTYRDFVSVDDVVKAIILGVHNCVGKRGDVFNVCSGNVTSIKEMAERTGKPIEYLPPKKGDIKYSCGINNKMQREWGWTPKSLTLINKK